jgi:carbon storage regulator CsrA
MLVLSRKNNESVIIGDPGGPIGKTLRVTVLGIVADKVRLGFEGADHVPINRCEVWRQIRSRFLREKRRIGRTAIPVDGFKTARRNA